MRSELMDVLVTAKAYPSISQTYGEAVCVAGVRVDTEQPEFVRFFPVPYRELPADQQFHKWEVVRLPASKHGTDRRAESWRPDTSSLERLQALPPGGHWPARRRWVEPLIGPTMCALNRGRTGGGAGPSLGIVKPARVVGVHARRSEEWSVGQQATVGQRNLLVEKSELEKPAYTFSYEWFCEEPSCRGHNQTIVDWEIGEAYRKWTRRGYEPISAVRRRWLDDICADQNDVYFFVGDQHRFAGQFLVLGAFYPKHRPHHGQLQLDLAA